jgi:hypothetical protein
MSDDLVKFTIPAEFVRARVLLTPGELVYGYSSAAELVSCRHTCSQPAHR